MSFCIPFWNELSSSILRLQFFLRQRRVIPDTQRPDKNPITSSFTVLFPDASQLAGGKPICSIPPSIHPPSESYINYCCFELNNVVRYFFSTKHILHSIIILFSEWLTSHRLSKCAAFDRANCAAMQQLARKGNQFMAGVKPHFRPANPRLPVFKEVAAVVRFQ